MTDDTNAAPTIVPEPLTFDATKTYDVSLKRSVEWPVGTGFVFSPRDHHLMSGAMCLEIAYGIGSAKQVQ